MTKHLKCDVLLYYKFIIQFGGERIFLKLVKIWQSYGKMVDFSCSPFALCFFLKEAELAR